MKSWLTIRVCTSSKALVSSGRPLIEPSITPTMTFAGNTTNSDYCTKSDTRSWATPPTTLTSTCSAWRSTRGYMRAKKHRSSTSRSMKDMWIPAWKVTGYGCTSDQSVPDANFTASSSLLPNTGALCVVGSGASPVLSAPIPTGWIADH